MPDLRLIPSFIILISLLEISIVEGNKCERAQVGRNHTFHGRFEHTLAAPLKIIWSRDKNDISHCIPRLGCRDTNENETFTSLKYLGNNNYEFQLVINNVTHRDAGRWSLKYFGPANQFYPAPIFTCRLKLAGDNDTDDESDDKIKTSTEKTDGTHNGRQEKIEHSTQKLNEAFNINIYWFLAIPLLIVAIICIVVCFKPSREYVVSKIKLIIARLYIYKKQEVPYMTDKYNTSGYSVVTTNPVSNV